MSWVIEKLGLSDLAPLRELLAREPVQNLYLLGVLEEFGIVPRPTDPPFSFWGSRAKGVLVAALFIGGSGGLAVPSAGDARPLVALAQKLGKTVTPGAWLGELATVDTLIRHLGPSQAKIRREHRLYCASADDLGPFTNPPLRLAEERDWPEVCALAARAVHEGFLTDPLATDASAFRSRVLRRIRHNRTYVLEAGARLVFKVDVGSRSRYGAELEGLYTLPDERGRGHATLSLGQLSRHLLSSLPRLTLRVDGPGAALAAVARKVGYVPGKAQRMVLS